MTLTPPLNRGVEAGYMIIIRWRKLEFVWLLKSLLRTSYSAGQSVIHLQPHISSVNVIQSPGLDLDN